jgi:hypothetical protein
VRTVAQRIQQRGMVMVIALIMLLAVTLMVVTSSNLVQANLKVVQNSEASEQARAAALAAIDEAISSQRFTTSPNAIFQNSCEVANQKCYDINGDGTDDILVQVLPPTCVAVQPRRNADLDRNNMRQMSCYQGASTTGGTPPVFSMCADSVWEFDATATDAVTGAQATVRQGVSILTALNNIETNCPLPPP